MNASRAMIMAIMVGTGSLGLLTWEAAADRPDGAPLSSAGPTGHDALPADPLRGTQIPVRSDTRAKYELLEWTRASSGRREAVTRREAGPDVSFARLEFDCAAQQYRTLATASALANISEQDRPTPMEPLASDALAIELAETVCAL